MTKFIVRGRGKGKTSALIERADMDKGHRGVYIVCADRNRAYNTAELARQLGADINFPLTPGEAIGVLGRGVRELLVDDVQDVLARVMGTSVPITVITGTNDAD